MIPKEKSGYLDVKLPSKLKSLKWKVWHHRWVVLHQLTDLADEKPIVRLTFYSNANVKGEGQGQRRERYQTVYLEDISGVTRVKSRTRRYAFAVTVGRNPSSAALLLAGNSESQSQSWMAVLRSCSDTPQPQRHLDIGEVYQDAHLVDGEASLSLGLTGHYLLVVSQNALSLYSPVDGQLCQEWRFNHLQRYGVNEQNVAVDDTNRILTIVTNRLCPSGEGTFSFFMTDAQEVLSQITTSIQRTLSKSTHEHPKVELTSDHLAINSSNDNNVNHRLSRASSCRLPRRAYINNNNSDDILHKRQGSLPCDVERVAFRDGSYSDTNMEILMRIRRETNSSYSDDNSKLLKLKSKKGLAGKMKNVDLNQNIERKEGSRAPTTSAVETLSQTIPVLTSGFQEISTPQSKIIETEKRSISPGLSAIIADNTSLTTPSYFRRPSWYSDTTNGDVESSSSEDYRELYPGRRSLPQPCLRHRSASTATSHSSSYGSWVDPREMVQRGHRRHQQADDISIGSSSSNEADDEVEVDSDGDVKTECLLRKSSANSHLYQELPDVNHCGGEHSHCALCYKPPATPPELPPRCELQSPVQSETSDRQFRCKAASVCCPREQNNPNSRDTQRIRSASDSQQTTGNPTGQGRIISSKDLCQEVKEMIPKPEMPSKLNRNVSMRRLQKSGKDIVDLNRKVPVSNNADKQESEYLKPQKNPAVNKIVKDDPMRKVSVLSGLYQDIDSLDEGEECHCHSDKDRPSTPPEPPPRNKNSRHADNQENKNSRHADNQENKNSRHADNQENKNSRHADNQENKNSRHADNQENKNSRHADNQENKNSRHTNNQEYYEDLDRFRKNIHKYLGIPLTDVNPPPPLPHRPLSLPAVSQVRQRTKSKLRSLGRKKKAQSTGDPAVSSSQTTDDNSSVDPRLRRVSNWPFRFGSLSRGTKLNSLVSENSYYSTREQYKPQTYPSVIDHQYPSFSCSSCGANNQLYANVMPPATTLPYSYYTPLPPPPPPAAIHRRYASTPAAQSALPNPFHELLRPPLQPWAAYDEQEREHLLQERSMWSADSALSDAPSQSVCESTASSSRQVAISGSLEVPYKEVDPTDSASDIYTDMSGVAEAMYIPMVPVADPASSKPEPIYVNWPPEAHQSEV